MNRIVDKLWRKVAFMDRQGLKSVPHRDCYLDMEIDEEIHIYLTGGKVEDVPKKNHLPGILPSYPFKRASGFLGKMTGY